MALSDPLKPLNTIFKSEDRLASWLRRYHLETQLTDHVRRQLPRLVAAQTRVADLRGGQMILSVPSGAVAVVVKQHLPNLTGALSSQGYKFKSILVQVQPKKYNKTAKITGPKRVPPPSAPLSDLERTLADGPLKEAIHKLMRKC